MRFINRKFNVWGSRKGEREGGVGKGERWGLRGEGERGVKKSRILLLLLF